MAKVEVSDKDELIEEMGPEMASERGEYSATTESMPSKAMMEIHRQTLNYDELQANYGNVNLEQSLDFTSGLRKSIRTNLSPVTLILNLFPIITWMKNYSFRNYLFRDVIAGTTIAILRIPQGMAYGILAGVGPIFGLYVSFFPVLIYSLMGTSHHISVGTFAVVSVMIQSTVYSITNGTASLDAVSNFTNSSGLPPTPVEIVASMSIVTGIIMALMGVFCLGSLSVILSDQLVSGFTTGVAFQVVVTQLSYLFDTQTYVKNSRSGALMLIKTLILNVENLHLANYVTTIISVVSILVLVISKEVIDPMLTKKYGITIPIPMDLILIVVVTGLSFALNFHLQNNVIIVGDLPAGLPFPKVPRFDFLLQILPSCIVLAIVTYAISISLAKIFAKKHGYKVRPNQELIAIGSANLFSSFFSCFPCCGSLSRSALQDRVGGKTQMAGFVSCIILLLVLLVLGPLLYSLPECILACVTIVALKPIFWQFKDLITAWKVSAFEGLTWLVAFFGVVIIDIDMGLLIAVCFSLFIIIFRNFTPTSTLLNRLSFTEIYVEKNFYPNSEAINGIKVFRFGAPLFFLNRDNFRQEVAMKTIGHRFDDITASSWMENSGISQTRWVILDFSMISYIDSSGIETLIDVITCFSKIGINCCMSECRASVLLTFAKTNFSSTQSTVPIYPTLHDAVLSCGPATPSSHNNNLIDIC